MINLTNKFTAIGQLQEANIQLYPTHIKIKLSLSINNIPLTLYQTISKRFNQQQYNNLIAMLPNLHCKITVWTVLHKLIFDKLLIEGERRTLTLYTKDGLKSFDMYEGVWWLDQFMHEQDNVEAVNRLKDKT